MTKTQKMNTTTSHSEKLDNLVSWIVLSTFLKCGYDDKISGLVSGLNRAHVKYSIQQAMAASGYEVMKASVKLIEKVKKQLGTDAQNMDDLKELNKMYQEFRRFKDEFGTFDI